MHEFFCMNMNKFAGKKGEHRVGSDLTSDLNKG